MIITWIISHQTIPFIQPIISISFVSLFVLQGFVRFSKFIVDSLLILKCSSVNLYFVIMAIRFTSLFNSIYFIIVVLVVSKSFKLWFNISIMEMNFMNIMGFVNIFILNSVNLFV